MLGVVNTVIYRVIQFMFVATVLSLLVSTSYLSQDMWCKKPENAVWCQVEEPVPVSGIDLTRGTIQW